MSTFGELPVFLAQHLATLIRPANSHKGCFGSVAVIGGATGMLGAALLAGRAALRLGAGKVWIGMLDPALPVDPCQPELMLLPARSVFTQHSPTHLLIGPGLGQSPEALQILQTGIAMTVPLILDADALNLLATESPLKQALLQRTAPVLITPHPAEAGRLLGCSAKDIQNERQQAAQQLANNYNCIVLLKGQGTLVVSQDTGSRFLNTTGNPALSSAGQGDILGGIILALVAQGIPLYSAACLGCHLHGLAADVWRMQNPYAIGLTASESIGLAQQALNRLLQGCAQANSPL